ncbi:hypothetical protein C8J56DRAFT_1170155, partial [Mycena floridula]
LAWRLKSCLSSFAVSPAPPTRQLRGLCSKQCAHVVFEASSGHGLRRGSHKNQDLDHSLKHHLICFAIGVEISLR